jgi:hypothetical protein
MLAVAKPGTAWAEIGRAAAGPSRWLGVARMRRYALSWIVTVVRLGLADGELVRPTGMVGTGKLRRGRSGVVVLGRKGWHGRGESHGVEWAWLGAFGGNTGRPVVSARQSGERGAYEAGMVWAVSPSMTGRVRDRDDMARLGMSQGCVRE